LTLVNDGEATEKRVRTEDKLVAGRRKKVEKKTGGFYTRERERGGGKEGGRGKKKEGVWASFGTAPPKGG
jgi:hypothetical protein